MRYITLILAMLSSVVCMANGGLQQTSSAQCTPPQYIELDCNGDGIVDRADIQEYVVGDFNGDGNEEYAALYYYKQLLHDDFKEWDYYKYGHYYKIAFGDKALPMKDVEWSACNLVNEGDLNGDSADEIGLFYWGGYTSSGTYVVHTYNGNEWTDLVCIRHNQNWNPAPVDELVRKDPNNDKYIIIQEIRLEDGKIMHNRVLLSDLPINNNESYPTQMVDDRLVALLTWERETSWQDYELKSRLQHEFERELEYYLQYNLKPSDSLPQLEKMINVITVPSGKFKFYNYWLDGGGTMSCDKNFIQFIDDDGYARCLPYLNDLRYPRGVCDVWEFEFGDKIYYAVKTYSRGMSSLWDYYLEIITFENDKIRTCTNFFCYKHGNICDTEEFYVYDSDGKIIDNDTRPAYYIRVCGTQNSNTNVGFDFDPKTLTVKVKDDGDTTDSRTGAIIKREWKLEMPKDNLEYEFSTRPAIGLDGYVDVTLKIKDADKVIFHECVGRVHGNYVFNKEDAFPSAVSGILTLKDNILYFVDVDFDGEDEIITGIRPFASSKRNCPAYRSIYKLINGRYVDVYDDFVDKCEVFSKMEPQYFSIDCKEKAIYYGSTAGKDRHVEVYSFANGSYTYDGHIESYYNRLVEFFDHKGNSIHRSSVSHYSTDYNLWTDLSMLIGHASR